MPELPEVETIVQQLKKKVLGKKITKVRILNSKKVSPTIKKVIPAKITGISRRAKAIIIELDKKKYLLVQLRMTGHFHYYSNGKEDPQFHKYVLVKFYLNDKSLLTHNSVRKFGGIKLINHQQLEKELAKLGPEPLSKELTLAKFKELLNKKKQANLKTALMNQKFLAGIGNIYAQEAAYHAKINPKRKIGSLNDQEISKLYTSLRHLLKKAIKHHGTTVESYVHIEGSGGFQKYLAVYQNKTCPKKHQIKKINLGGRGTYYCPKCQK